MRHLDGKANISTEDIWPGNTNSGKTKEIQKLTSWNFLFLGSTATILLTLWTMRKYWWLNYFYTPCKLKLGKLKKSIESWYHDIMISWCHFLHTSTERPKAALTSSGGMDWVWSPTLSVKYYICKMTKDEFPIKGLDLLDKLLL